MSRITVEGIEIELTRKPVKRLTLRVLPSGEVRMTLPRGVPEGEARRFAGEKADWLREKRAEQLARPKPRQRQYESGETVFLWGRALTLELCFAPRRGVTLEGDTLRLCVRANDSPARREAVLAAFYRAELERAVPPLLAYYETRLGVKAADWHIRDMSSRWGSCALARRRICLNLRLAERARDCLAYVVAHELAHLLEGGHNARFWALVERVYPDWRRVRGELRRPLGAAEDAERQ